MVHMSEATGVRIDSALKRSGLSQRDVAKATGISQATISRIITGERAAKMTEVLMIAWETGTTVAELTGAGAVADRMQCVARATGAGDVSQMHASLMGFLELDAYLEDQAIPA